MSRKVLSSSGWLGMDYTANDSYYGCSSSSLCIEPPDPSVAVGPNDVVQTVNTEMRVYGRSGNIRSSVHLPELFGTELDLLTSDPQVAYHAQSGRWFMTVISADCNTGYLHLAVSDTSDPAGAWSTYTYDYPYSMPDYPGLGFSGDKVVIGVNEFDLLDCQFGYYLGTSALVADIPDILDDSSHWYARTDTYDSLWDWRPAVAQSSEPETHSIVTDDYGYFYHVGMSGSVVDLAENTLGGNPIYLWFDDLYSEFAPQQTLVAPVQPGGSLDVDERVTSAVWSTGRLVFVSTYPCISDSLYDCVRVSELDTTNLTQNQDFLIGDGANGYDSYMGGIALTDNGTLYMVWTRSRSDAAASILGAYQLPGSSPNTLATPSLIRAGGGAYAGDRWGDFAILADDPNDASTAWQGHEFALANGGWGTYVSHLSVAAAPTFKPDGRVRKGTGAWVGNNIYNTTGLNQAVSGTKTRGATLSFDISIQNDAAQSDQFTVLASGASTTMYTVTFFRGATNITAAVIAGTYTTPSVGAGSTYVITAKVKVNTSATKGSSVTRLVTITSIGDGTKQDAVMFTGARQ